MSRYTSLTDDDLRVMLAEIGAASIDELFASVPERVRLRDELNLPACLSQQEVLPHLTELPPPHPTAAAVASFLWSGS